MIPQPRIAYELLIPRPEDQKLKSPRESQLERARKDLTPVMYAYEIPYEASWDDNGCCVRGVGLGANTEDSSYCDLGLV